MGRKRKGDDGAFARLAGFVVRHAKAVLAAWILILILAVPASTLTKNVIVYEEESSAPSDSEASRAERAVHTEFPGTVANSTAIVVLHGDVDGPGARDFALRFGDEVRGSRGIRYLDNVTSAYSVIEYQTRLAAGAVSGGLNDTRPRVGSAASLVFGLPAGWAAAWPMMVPQVNDSASLLYGLPSAYLGAWYAMDPGMPIGERNIAAYNATLPMVPQNFTAVTYFSLWYYAWNGSTTASPPVGQAEAGLRAQAAVDATAAAMFNLSTPEGAFAGAVVQNLRINNWTGAGAMRNATASIVKGTLLAQSGGNATSLPGLYLTALEREWRADPSLGPADMQTLVNRAAPAALPSTGTEGLFFSTVYRTLGAANWTDAAAVNNTAVAVAASMGGLPEWFVRGVAALGPSPSDDAVRAYARAVVANGTLYDTPFPLRDEVRARFVNRGNDTMLVMVSFTKSGGFGGDRAIPDNIRELRRIAPSVAKEAGLRARVMVSGDAALGVDLGEEADRDLQRIDPVTVAMVLILLVLFFRSVVTPFVSLGAIGIAIAFAQVVLLLVGTFVAKVHYSVLTIMFTLMLGVGVDYCIFIIARFREELAGGAGVEDAVRTAVRWAGESIATSGATVIIAFAALSVASFSLTKTMGLVLSLGVAVTLLVALTFLPALLTLAGGRIFWPAKTWRAGRYEAYFARAARTATRRAVPILAAALLISLPAGYLAMTMKPNYDFIATLPPTESKDGLEAMGEGFGKGEILATQVVVKFPSVVANNTTFDAAALDSVDALADRLAALDNVRVVRSSTYFLGQRIDAVNFSAFPPEMRNSTIARAAGKSGNTVLLTVVMQDEPMSEKSMETVPRIRDEARRAAGSAGAEVLVGGATASMKEVGDTGDREYLVMRAIVIAGVAIVLVLVLRSLLVPATAIITMGLSVSWVLAATYLAFPVAQGIPIIWMMPMLLFVILMGLGMDYNIFILTRVREERMKGRKNNAAIITAVEKTGGIVTACGAIMAGAFASMLLSTMGLLKEFGFGLSLAIVLDAMVVRIYLMPAMLAVGGKWNWWFPGRKVNPPKAP